ncbi:MAG: hypothetical protein QXN37_02570 [Candidatus Anstonellaceae archaeon]
MDIKKIFAGRMFLLLPAAFCIFLVLESQDKTVRLAAIICLLLIAQIREWLLLQAKKL